MTTRKKNVINTCLPAWLPGRNEVQHRCGGDGARHLGDNIRQYLARSVPARGPQSYGDRGIEVAAGDVSHGISHGQHGQAEGECDPKEPDAERWIAGREHRTSASAKGQPEGSEELCSGSMGHIHCHFPPISKQQILTREAEEKKRKGPVS
jgi:hypothetical protein